jgi:non-specific serine/threonine protein kinase
MAATNLPVQFSSFIGREREIADLQRLLLSSHLVTLTGAGGSGKTRLALQVANSVLDAFPDGGWWIDLAPLHDPTLIPQLVTQTLRIPISADEPVLETLLHDAQQKQLLLILDNCEHLSDACAQFARQLLSFAPGLRILATSREVLGIVGEAIYPVTGMDCPDGEPLVESGQSRKDLNEWLGYDAVHLFVDRARACAPNFRLTFENASAIVEICCRLDGLPLALELASARMNVLTVQEIADRLNDRFGLLTAGPRSGYDPRHQTLRSTIDWSYSLLSTEEQFMFRRLAIFEAGFTLETAQAVCSDGNAASLSFLEAISSLVSKSLVVADTVGSPQARYLFLETIREYALEKLAEAGEIPQLRDRHLEFFLTRAEEAASKIFEAYQQLWLNWLEGEHNNLHAALAWSLESHQIEHGLRIAMALVGFWNNSGFWEEGLAWYKRLLAHTDDQISSEIRVRALVYVSYMAASQGDSQASIAYGQEAVAIAEKAGVEGSSLLAFALAGLASSARAIGDHQTAYNILERAIPIFRESGPPFYFRGALYFQAENATQLGDTKTARELLDESLALFQQAGDFKSIANLYNSWGDLARLEQNYTEAARAYEKSASQLRELDSQRELASVLGNLGFTYLHFRNVEKAAHLFNESMDIHLAYKNRPGKEECLIGFAAIAVMGGLPADGVRLLAAAAASSGLPSTSIWRATRMEIDRYTALARARLTEANYQAEQAAGQAMTLEQAIAYARNLPLKSDTMLVQGEMPEGLTDRECEIAMLIGQGKTNHEIAAELVLSKRTVETHVSNILSKLDFSSRTQIMRWVIDHRLPGNSA